MWTPMWTPRDTMCIDDYDDCPTGWDTHVHPKKEAENEPKWYLTHHELHLKFWPQDEYEEVTKKKDTNVDTKKDTKKEVFQDYDDCHHIDEESHWGLDKP